MPRILDIKKSKSIKILHILKLSGIGGVQSQFEVFFNNLSLRDKKRNFVVNIGSIDTVYNSILPFGNGYIEKILIYLFSRNVIIHSYNNLTSKKYNLVYELLKPSNLIFHERGNAWNLSISKKHIVLNNAKLAKLIVCNSEATKIILNKKFGVDKKKLVVIYNGVISDYMIKNSETVKRQSSKNKYIIGYVGRLETNKGVQSLIKSMSYLDNDKFELHIIGDGSLRKELENYANELNLKSIFFQGRVKDAWSEMINFDVMVIPSIREPLGNVIIEAALQRVPVVASKVDGIIEIVCDKFSGIVITPSSDVDERFVSTSVPLPEYVVDVENEKLLKPMQLDALKLSEAILYLSKNKSIANAYSEKLYDAVINKFHIDKYHSALFHEYEKMIRS
jgi:glycosyltransferase involved in cell wall biosynthesis